MNRVNLRLEAADRLCEQSDCGQYSCSPQIARDHPHDAARTIDFCTASVIESAAAPQKSALKKDRSLGVRAVGHLAAKCSFQVAEKADRDECAHLLSGTSISQRALRPFFLSAIKGCWQDTDRPWRRQQYSVVANRMAPGWSDCGSKASPGNRIEQTQVWSEGSRVQRLLHPESPREITSGIVWICAWDWWVGDRT